jgi:hypothetical protein
MNNVKTFVIWLAICLATAAGTILAVQTLDKPLGLQPKIAHAAK